MAKQWIIYIVFAGYFGRLIFQYASLAAGLFLGFKAIKLI